VNTLNNWKRNTERKEIFDKTDEIITNLGVETEQQQRTQ
jgi:hypothetical protein